MNVIFLNCGERYRDIVDHRSSSSFERFFNTELLTNFVCFRFGTHVSGAPAVQRSLRINNTSPYGELWETDISFADMGFVGVEHHGVLRECNSEALYKGKMLVMPSRVLTSSYP